MQRSRVRSSQHFASTASHNVLFPFPCTYVCLLMIFFNDLLLVVGRTISFSQFYQVAAYLSKLELES